MEPATPTALRNREDADAAAVPARMADRWNDVVTRYRPLLPAVRLMLAGVLTAIVVLHLVDLLRRYYVDVLYMDAWEMVPLVDKTYQGTASIADFWAQANEHRPVFP